MEEILIFLFLKNLQTIYHPAKTSYIFYSDSVVHIQPLIKKFLMMYHMYFRSITTNRALALYNVII